MNHRHVSRCAAVVTFAALTAPAIASAGNVSHETIAGRNVRVFVPSKPNAAPSLVVLLHGCTQLPDEFAEGTKMEEVAEAAGFFVATPEQPTSADANRCWRWYATAHQSRDAGEPKDLADLAANLTAAHGVSADRVYVAGISAGAAMGVILGATYPDRFKAIGVIAGLEYKAATSYFDSFTATVSGGPDPDTQGALAKTAMGSNARAVPVMEIHGSADGVVAPINGEQVTAQWLRTNTLILGDGAIDAPTTATEQNGYSFTRKSHKIKATGAVLVEQLVVSGMGHAWPGGKAGASYSDPKGPNASQELWAFFDAQSTAAPSTNDGGIADGGKDGGAATTDGGGAGSAGDAGSSSDASTEEFAARPTDSGCSIGALSTTSPKRTSGATIAALLALVACGLTRSVGRRRDGRTPTSRERP